MRYSSKGSVGGMCPKRLNLVWVLAAKVKAFWSRYKSNRSKTCSVKGLKLVEVWIHRLFYVGEGVLEQKRNRS